MTVDTALLCHLWRTQPEKIAAGSFLDCHAKGLHSLMLLNAPGAVVRMFVATPDHDMGRNFSARDELSIAFHNHDADITLHVVCGQIAQMTLGGHEGDGETLSSYRYASKIRDGRGGFVRHGRDIRVGRRCQWLPPGESLFMRSDDIHTIAVAPKEFAAWFVYEGPKNPAFEAIAFSNAPLESFNASGLYRQPTLSEVDALIAQVIYGPGNGSLRPS